MTLKTKPLKKYCAQTLIGLMSGSSLDGLDVAEVHFFFQGKKLEWNLQHCTTLPYSKKWTARLRKLSRATVVEVLAAHAEFGHYLGTLLSPLLQKWHSSATAIALHGHTLFHEPNLGFSFQLGNAQHLAFDLNLPVISNFRQADIALGGQGAPMAPLADQWLFPGYRAYLNIGGIANLTIHHDKGWQACDIGPANQLFNALAQEAGCNYDEDGKLGSRGSCLQKLLNEALKNPYYHHPPPKSLSNQWIQEHVIPLFSKYNASVEDRLHTAYQLLAKLLAHQIRNAFGESPKQHHHLFLSGGGAHNNFLRQCLQQALKPLNFSIHLPQKTIINFKEAMLMALAGYFRLIRRPNFLPQTTGAREAACGGNIYYPNSPAYKCQ